MTTGLVLVRAHLDSFMAGRIGDFDRQLAPTFRYRFLPPVLGEGPPQARRWRNILASIYRDWSYEIEDEREDGDSVTMKLSFTGLDPVEPENTVAQFYDTCLFEIDIKAGRLMTCGALFLPFEAHEMLPTDTSRRSA